MCSSDLRSLWASMLVISGPLYLAKRMMTYCGWLNGGPPFWQFNRIGDGHSGSLLSDFGADQIDPRHFVVAMKDLLGWIEIANRKVPFCYFAAQDART